MSQGKEGNRIVNINVAHSARELNEIHLYSQAEKEIRNSASV